MSDRKICLIYGTRPEAIKIAPIASYWRKAELPGTIESWVTGQHREMLRQVCSVFSIIPDYDLDLMTPNQTLTQLSANTLLKVSELLNEMRPACVVVQGDTTTALMAAMAAFYHKIPVAHVEAGLRTSDIYSPFPEEANRQMISRIASTHFAPTPAAALNLQREGISQDHIVVSGNTVIDALLEVSHKLKIGVLSPSNSLLELNKEGTMILVTCHRRENFGEPVLRICQAIKQTALLHREAWFLIPVHPNPNVKVMIENELHGISNIVLTDPLNYVDFIWAMNRCSLILTDSGGVQEEAPSLQKPFLVLRENSERPEAIEAGFGLLVGTDTSTICREINKFLISGKDAAYPGNEAANPYGDGLASKRICDELVSRYL